jgi:hypothetical protein
MAAASPASAQPLQPADLNGRWVMVSAEGDPCPSIACLYLSYDFVPCGTGWCGIEVRDPDDTCGSTEMRLEAAEVTKSGVTFRGRFVLSLEENKVLAILQLSTQPKLVGQPQVVMQEHTDEPDGLLGMFKRGYPPQVYFVRAGDAKCQAEPIS